MAVLRGRLTLKPVRPGFGPAAETLVLDIVAAGVRGESSARTRKAPEVSSS
jgi:hypothetical protein